LPITSVSETGSLGLHNVNLAFLAHKLSIVTGETGSGKSLPLATLLSETNLKSDRVGMPKPDRGEKSQDKEKDWIVPGSTALASQLPWIDYATIRENITFGLPFEPYRYRDVVKAYALERDITQMEKRDETKVGAKGAVLNSGQRWLIALARAVYSRASILLLDDVLSAVDGAVATWILEHALSGTLAQSRTIIWVTYNLDLCLQYASYVVELRENTVRGASLVGKAPFKAGWRE
jgi:ABC-type multidrug transport system fused ATPase/permease subunit